MLSVVDRVLRSDGRLQQDQALSHVALPELVVVVATGGAVYGAAMGSFAGHLPQLAYSALKVPLLLGVSTALCLPNFFVVNTLLGLRSDFAAACRAILAAQGALTITLASAAPVTLFAYVASDDYAFAKLLNGAVFLVASVAGQIVLSRHYRPLVAANPRHRAGLCSWLLLDVFVAVQLAWLLRPFVGHPDMPAELFRADAWGNAYVEVAEMAWRVVRRLVGR